MDQTLEFLNNLRDPSKYEVIKGIPVFAPHERKEKKQVKNADGTTSIVTSDIKVDVAKLQLAADVANKRFKDRGVPSLVCPGHRSQDPNFPEEKQPPVYAFALDYRVEPSGPDGMPSLVHDHYVKKARLEDYKGFPFRSVEYYPNADLITGIALLIRDPFLDMGVVSFESGIGWLGYQAQPLESPPSFLPANWTPRELGPALFYQAENKMPDEKAKPGQPAPAAPTAAQPAAPGQPTGEPQGHAEWKANMDHYAKSAPWMGYAMKCYEGASAMAAPSATNTLPNPNQPAQPAAPATPAPAPATPNPAEKPQMNQTPEIPLAYQAAMQRMETEVAALNAKANRADAERVIYQLQMAGIKALAKPEEVVKFTAEFAAMTPEARDAEAKKMLKYWEKDPNVSYALRGAPVGPMIPIDQTHAETPNDPDAPMTEEKAEKATKYMRENGCSWEEAKTKTAA